MVGHSWWVKGDKIIEVDHHKEYVAEHPEEFGLTPEEFKAIVDKAEETGTSAKEEIVVNHALNTGWIRVRYNSARDASFWAVNVKGFRGSQRDAIANFCMEMIIAGKMSKEDPIVIMDFYDNMTYEYSWQNGGVGKFLSESKKTAPERRKRETYSSGVGGAWWFKKGAEPISTEESKHITLLLRDPEKFGLTEEYIDEVYESFGEILGTEGRAREKLIKEVVQSGWIRVRHYVGREDYWSFTVNDFRSQKEEISEFCWWAISSEKLMSKNDSMVIISLRDNETYRYFFTQGGVESFLNEKKIPSKNIVMEKILNRFK